MAEGGRTPAKCELSITSAFDICQAKMSWEHLVSLTVLVWWMRLRLFSPNSSSQAHSEGTFKCARFSRELAFAWSETGTKISWAWYNWKRLSWRQSALQAWDVGKVASKFQTSHMGSSHWCPWFDGRTSNCLKDTNKILQFLQCYWYVSICFKHPN